MEREPATVMPADDLASRDLTGSPDPRPEAPLGAGDVDALLTESSVAVLVFTEDDALLATLSGVSGGQHPVHATADEAAAMALLARLDPGVLVVDAAACTDVAALCARMQRHQPGLVSIVVAARAAASELMGLVGGEGVLRVLPAPLSMGQARLALEAAVRRHLALAAVAPDQGAQVPAMEAAAAPPARVARGALLAGSVVALVVLAAAGAWVMLDRERSAPPAGDTSRSSAARAENVSDSVPPQRAAEAPPVLLEQAEAALMAGRVLGPAPDSAEMLLRRVLEADPANGRARLGLERVWLAELGLAEQALAAGDAASAEQRLQAVAARTPGHPRLAMLQDRLRRQTAEATAPAVVIVPATPTPVAEPAPTAAETAETTEIEAAVEITDTAENTTDEALAQARAQRGILALVQERLARGWLLAPRGDSAADYLEALRETGAGPAMLFVAEQQLARALLAQSAAAVATDDLAGARTALAYARDLGVVPLEVGAAERVLSRAERLADARTRVVPESELERLDYRAPEYPRRAYRANQEGWVELAFVVGRDGYPDAIRVIEAEPPGVFEDSAAAALARWRYRPVQVEGEIIEQPAFVRLRFEIR
ncbi:MAG: energy transducer TonB [Gammaproteobacteria bacterium]|nr:energy transducer TonB [Gammaproteobacteria bacterium]